jgi:hypothetical protein
MVFVLAAGLNVGGSWREIAAGRATPAGPLVVGAVAKWAWVTWFAVAVDGGGLLLCIFCEF